MRTSNTSKLWLAKEHVHAVSNFSKVGIPSVCVIPFTE